MKSLVKWFIAGNFVVWILFDVWLAVNGGPTESMVLREIGLRYTFFPFLLGFIAGHWWWPREKPWANGWMWALPFLAALIAWDIFWPSDHWTRFPAIWAAIGFPTGSFLWGQSKR